MLEKKKRGIDLVIFQVFIRSLFARKLALSWFPIYKDFQILIKFFTFLITPTVQFVPMIQSPQFLSNTTTSLSLFPVGPVNVVYLFFSFIFFLFVWPKWPHLHQNIISNKNGTKAKQNPKIILIMNKNKLNRST